MHSLVGWAKAVARPSTRMRDSRAPCPRCHNSQLRKTAWARRTRDFGLRHRTANAFAHPTRLCITLSQKKFGPCLRLWARGRPHSCLFASPSGEGVGAPTRRMARITPGGVSGLLRTKRCTLRCTPRLAARQRGILAFMPLTVVGPGRLLVAGEAARVRPGDGGCVSHPLAGAAPVPRLQNASGRRPS